MKKKYTRLVLALIFLGIAGIKTVQAQESNDNKIHFINVNEGASDAIILESNGHFAMIDTGEDYDFPDGSDPRYPWRNGIDTSYKYVLTDRVFRRLNELGVQKLDFILITHAHSDHSGNADELIRAYPVGRVYMKKYEDSRISTQNRLWDNQYGYDQVLKAAADRGVPVIQDISKEASHFLLGDMDIQLYNYENETDSSGALKKVWDDNSNSIISVIQVNGKKIYLGGDLDNVHGAEDKYGPQIGKVDLMKFNHHYDTSKSNTKAFVSYLSPSLIVQTTDSLPWNFGIDYEYMNWLKSKGIERINAASTRYDATVFDIRSDGFYNISSRYHTIPSFEAGWHLSSYGNWWYQAPDSTGEYAVGWNKIDGEWYYFNSSGILLQGQWKKWNHHWFYPKDSGASAQGWLNINDAWYYFNQEYQMETGWIYSGGQYYYLSDQGEMKTGWNFISGHWYYLAQSGEMKTGWIKDQGQWYYLDANGSMKIGDLALGAQQYYLDETGAMATGWVNKQNSWYYYHSDGSQAHGWIKDGEHWYFLKENGELLVNARTPEGYTVDASGVWVSSVPIEKSERSSNSTETGHQSLEDQQEHHSDQVGSTEKSQNQTETTTTESNKEKFKNDIKVNGR